MKVLITGANGFVGRHLCERLHGAGHEVVAALRRGRTPRTSAVSLVRTVENLGPTTDWDEVLTDVDAVVHLAARVHVLRDSDPEAIHQFHQVNVLGTERLARAAAEAGVRHFLFLSSVKVHGERTAPGIALTEDFPLEAEDAYGRSKREAESVLQEIAAETGLGLTILRPPLVYGPGVGANFERLLHAVYHRFPLPLAAVENRRSLIFVGNLVDAITRCLERSDSFGQTFLVSDGPAVSTAELIRELASALRRTPRLFRLPPRLLRRVGKLAGREAELGRLLDDLVIDDTRIRTWLHWRPPFHRKDGLRITALDWIMARQMPFHDPAQ
ncbi:MAG TPA: NAD-dependent epimerase/dehydratase family protein [Methylococcus sp.]|nr:NAD-dependent epimerase/dehydratase family protein [Methylococcus sp.]